jgi:hypothetical protein
MRNFIASVLLIVVLIVTGCSSTQEPVPTEVSQPAEEEPQAEVTPDISPEVVDEPPAQEFTDPPVEEEPDEEVAQEEADEELGEEVEQGTVEEYIPTQETYDRTFSEVEETIAKLNEIIRDQDYEEWQSYLTAKYRREMSSPEKLRELSEHRILKRNNIQLTSLQDYFRFVVVPSRANARLDDLVFRNDDEVEAIMIIQGQRVILYQLRKVDGRWKIDIF